MIRDHDKVSPYNTFNEVTMGYKHVIWDWNGTLLNDIDLAVTVMQGMLADRAMPSMGVERYKDILTFPIRDYYEAVGFDFATHPFEELSDAFVEGYGRYFDMCGLQQGAKETLEAVKAMGIGQSILTAGPQEGVREQVVHFGIREYFETITGDTDHHASGKIKLVKRHMDKINVEGKDCLFIGDTDHDVAVAEAIGCDCMLVAFGHQARHILEETGRPIAENYGDVLAYMKG